MRSVPSSHAAQFGADLDVGLYTLEDQSVAVSSHGLRIEPDGQLPVDSDLVVVPGGGWGTRAESGVMDEMAYERRGKVHR